MRYLIFDTETTGLPRNWNAPITDTNNWPRCVQIAWQLHDEWGKLIEAKNYIVYPEDYNIPYEAQKIHGISTALAQKEGKPLKEVMQAFNAALAQTDFLVGQNLNFDLNIVGAEFVRLALDTVLHKLPVLDTCTEKTANLCRLPGGKGGKFKLPNLTELHQQLFGTPFMEAHNATADVEATTRCFFELLRQGHFSVQELKNTADYLEQFQQKNPKTIENWGIVHINLAELSRGLPLQSPEAIVTKNPSIQKNIALSPELEKASFAHLHNHSQYSVLQSTIEIAALVAQAAKEGQSAVALTDSGNMMGAFAFVQEIIKHNKKNLEKPLKGIIGCELSVCRNRLDKTQKDNGYPIVLLAKNKNGYRNLSVLSSLAYTEGFYYIPRIDKNILQTYTQDLICLTGNLYGEIPQLILSVGEKQAEEALLWYHSIFKENLYLEIMRHSPEGARVPEEEEQVNQVLIQFSKKYNIPLLATNNTYYLQPQQASAHDILLCVKEGEKQNTPIGKGRGFRYGLNNQEYYFKSSQAMKSLFADIPEAILTIQNIIDAVENYDLATPVLLPKFDIPENFNSEDEYLEHLVFAGAVERYPHLTPEIKERICFELSVIAKTGYPGYFLIVQDFIRKAREMGVVVGPGRGSAAGAVVAYCTGITNVDPLEHGLLFERFLNPDRVSMPDIDIDFDDEGRQKVIDYVIHKYGASQVAQIITYGTMAAKSAIRDTARVLDLPLFEADKLSKIFPDSSLGLRTLLAATEVEIQEEFKNNSEEKTKAQTLRALSVEKNLIGQTLRQAALLEGSLRNTGTHACGLIITPSDMKALVPIALVKDSEMFCTQFDNAVVEYAGLLKMDFLGLRTLTIIRDACLEIKRRQNIDINIDKIPMDDAKTYELFQRGETIGIFQYESAGMQKYLKELKPTVFGDLVAMNALYRPGPLQYIPSFIRRKNGAEPIQYDIQVSKQYLEETYGIVVYQEQVMLLSQLLADFTKGEADALRKAMGKKQRSELDKMKPQFIAQASAKGHDAKVLEKIWTDWEAFAAYAFNKSHSVCYALVAYQTAYLKANYPSEYMAAVLSNNLNDIKSVSFFIGECKRMKVPVLPADVNEAGLKFSVNTSGSIRFALTAIKGVGQAAVENIIQERQKNAFVSMYDFVSRIDLRQCNKKTLEALALSGAFDQFKTFNRWDYFAANAKGQIFIEDLIKYGSKVKEGKQMKKMSLFGDSFIDEVKQPLPEQTEKWTPIYQLEREKEVVGIYISGHPLDQYALEFKFLCNSSTADLTANIEQLKGKAIKMGGVIVDAQHKIAKNGNGYGAFTLKDFQGEYKMMLFGEDYLRFKPFITENILIYLEGTVLNKWGREDALDFKLQKMELLPEVGEKYFKKLSLYIPIGRINAQFTADLQALLLQHKGTKELRIHLVHEPENQIFPFKTQKYGVYIHPQLFESLNALDLHYEL